MIKKVQNWLNVNFNFLKIKTIYNIFFLKSDYNRWKNINNFNEDWNERTVLMSELVDQNITVLEFGCGKQVLKKLLVNCIYIPSDIVDRGNNTLVFDLNKDIIDIKNVDMIVFSGVLEYIHDLNSLITSLRSTTNSFLISYAISELNSKERLRHGWVNNYTEKELIKLFNVNKFLLIEKKQWKNQIILKFVKK